MENTNKHRSRVNKFDSFYTRVTQRNVYRREKNLHIPISYTTQAIYIITRECMSVHSCSCVRVSTLPTYAVCAQVEQNDRTDKQVYLSTVSIVITGASYCGEYNNILLYT